MDFALIEQRIKDQFYRPDTPQIAAHALAVLADGRYFSDIDYSCTAPTGWPILNHLINVAALSACYAYQTDSRYYADPSVKEKIIGCLSFWFEHDFHNPNWWYNDLGVPQQMRMIALYMKEELPRPLLDKLTARLQDDIEAKWTGTNRMWFAENMLVKAVILQNEGLLLKAREYLRETTRVAQQPGIEGMQVDGSYAQHGMQLYNNGYGFSFLSCITKWMYILDTDGAKLDDSAVSNVTRLVLDGDRFMCRFDEIDPHTRSREIVRGFSPIVQHQMESRIPSIQLLISVNRDPQIKNQLQDLIDFIKKNRTNPGIEANTMYYRLDFMTHSHNKFYASTRLVSKNSLGGDVCGSGDDKHAVNGENILAGLMGYGTTLLMQDGSEYHNIYPLWDWGRLPAVTSPDIALHLDEGSLCKNGFAGGASADCFGVCAMAFEKTYTHQGHASSFGGRKAVFYFEDKLFFIGDRLHTTAPEPFQTTLDQCFFQKQAVIDGAAIRLGDTIAKTADKLYHNGICFAMYKPTDIVAKAEIKTGKWSTISVKTPIPEKLDTAQGDIFTAYIPHTDKENASYAYAVLPGVTEAEADSYDVRADFEQVQDSCGYAVYCKSKQTLMAVFFGTGTLTTGGHTLVCDKSCFVIVQGSKLSIAAPSLESETVVLNLDGKIYRIEVEGGVYRGRTKTVSI